MAKAKKPADEELDAVFLGAAPAEDAEMSEDDEDPEAEEALDAAIDEAFTTEDPEARREAFKNAMRLCKDY